jgi:hypothetical protein
MRRLLRIPTFSSENKRVLSGAILGLGGGVLWIVARVLPSGWVWGTVGGVGWVLLYLGAYFLVNRPSRYNGKVLEAQLNILVELMGVPKSADLRAVLWAPTDRRRQDMLEQVTNYVPSVDADRGPGRLVETSKGIIGYAFRTKKDKVNLLPRATFSDDESLIRHQVDRWGFTEQEARQFKPGRRSQLAVPVVNTDSKVLGVIYCDSSSEDTFGPELAADVVALAPLFRQLLLLEGD